MTTVAGTTAILTMALGGPESLEDVGPYLREIRGGRPTPPELVEEFRERYAKIGGASPLLRISTAQARALETRLRGEGRDVRAYVGMRHWHPFIREAVARIAADGVERAVALCLTPYYSRLSVGAYLDAVAMAVRDQAVRLDVAAVESWNDVPALANAFAAKVRKGLDALARDGHPDPFVLFTAHSLPRKPIEAGDPYERELTETRDLILRRLPKVRHSLAYQSAGRTAGPWLGPAFESVLEELANEGERAVLVVPFGFVSDHLEILYDIDIAGRAHAAELGLRLERTDSLNDDPAFVEAMAAAVGPRLRP